MKQWREGLSLSKEKLSKLGTNNATDRQKSIPFSFKFGANVPFAYANYEDCGRYDIEPIPWLWGEYWVRERIDHCAKIIGIIVNKPHGTFIDVYKRITQPHPYDNLVVCHQPLSWHIVYDKIPIDNLDNCSFKFDQLLSWNAIHFITDIERLRLFKKISDVLHTEKSSLVFSFLHRLNLSSEGLSFFKSKRYKKNNHQYHSHVNLKKILSTFKSLNLIKFSESIQYAYGFDNYDEKCLIENKEIITSKQFDVIDIDQFSDVKDIIPVIEDAYISWAGIHLKFDL
jgi:hypothetical protein